MFDWLKSKKESTEETEFSFVWWKEMNVGTKKFYTKPFRTKVKGKNIEEAKEKLKDFALSKMKLVIVPEGNFNKTDLSAFEEKISKISNEIDEFFKNLKF